MKPLDAPPTGTDAEPTALPRNRVSPKKLLLSKWTAVTPQRKEKHFVVVRVIEPETPDMPIADVEMEAVHSRRLFLLHWRELKDSGQWRRGWV